MAVPPRSDEDGPVTHDAVVEPVTDCGTAMVAVAATLAERFAAEAGERDRAARFDPAVVATLHDAGLGAACVPADLGGADLVSLRDLMAVASTLATGDGSLALVAHMHLSGTWGLARAVRAGVAPDGAAALLRAVAAGEAWFCAAVTEAGTNYFHPRTTLQARPDGSWVLAGRKVFATGSPAATIFSTNARIVGGAWDGRLATTFVPAATPGVTVVDDWDGLGMRASGSGEVRFDDAVLPAATVVLPAGPWGTFTAAALQGRAFGNVGNVAAMGGVALAARRLAVARVRGEGRVSSTPLGERHTVRASLAELDVDLAVLRAVLCTLGDDADERSTHPTADLEEAHRFMAGFQAAKLTTNRLATAIVDRAAALCGGSAYGGGHPLARLTRDVRAGVFMQPFSPHEALGYVGAVAAGVEPDVEA